MSMRTHFCGLIDESLIGQTVTLAGWTDVARNQGGVCFIDLRDHYGMTQVLADSDSPAFSTLEKVRAEWVVRIDGRG